MKGKKDNYFDIIHCLCLHCMCMRFQMIHFSSSVWVKNDFCHKDHINECSSVRKSLQNTTYIWTMYLIKDLCCNGICVVTGSLIWRDLYCDGIFIYSSRILCNVHVFSSIQHYKFLCPPPFFFYDDDSICQLLYLNVEWKENPDSCTRHRHCNIVV